MKNKEIEEINERFSDKTPQELLQFFITKYNNKIALASSLSMEDQVLTDMVTNINKKTKIFALDTGRLFPETYDLLHKTNSRYNINIKIYFPDNIEVEEMVNKKGINLFYESVENRKLCCRIRKVNPLKRAFKGLEAWICGLRHEQSDQRQNLKKVEWDEANKLLKINPIINWSDKNLRDYIKTHNVPYNPLHDKNYPSIGCQPCTRAIIEGENNRAGRWYWENENTKECGLHAR